MTGRRTPEQIEAEVAAQREELAHTVDELAAKLDVKSRAQTQVARLQDKATTATGSPRPELVVAAAALVAAFVTLAVWRHSRSR